MRGGVRPGAGRPRDPQARRQWVSLRVDAERRARWVAAAERDGAPSLSEWVSDLLDEAAARTEG